MAFFKSPLPSPPIPSHPSHPSHQKYLGIHVVHSDGCIEYSDHFGFERLTKSLLSYFRGLYTYFYILMMHLMIIKLLRVVENRLLLCMNFSQLLVGCLNLRSLQPPKTSTFKKLLETLISLCIHQRKVGF